MTPQWEFLIHEAALSSLLPAEHARFARPIRDALIFFLGGLNEDHQASILRAQAVLPASAPFSQRIGLLAQSCPVLQKLGQILARDQRLAPELRFYLRQLESLPPAVPLEVIQEMLTQELGPLTQRSVTLLPPAIAEASVAVVIPFRQHGGAPGEAPRDGVFKVLKPGIEQQLEQELKLLEQVGAHLDRRCAELEIPQLDYEESFQQVSSKLMDEVQLENEQRHLVQAQAFFADEPQVQIPALLPHCTSRVTAMERVSGDKVTHHGLNHRRQRRRLAKLLAKALIAKPVFSTSDQAMFHGDPHAGNLFFTSHDHLAILDWSLAGKLGSRERIAIVQVILGALTLDSQRIVTVLEPLADPQRLDKEALKSVVEQWVKRVRRGQFPGLGWLVGLLDDAVQRARLRVPADLMLFRKMLHTLEGVVGEVGEGRGQIDRTLRIEFLRHFAAEWPLRWLRLPHSRDFATRLSNLDVTRTLLNSPAAATRFWTGHAVDILEACVQRWAAGLRPDVPSGGDAPPVTMPSAPRTNQE